MNLVMRVKILNPIPMKKIIVLSFLVSLLIFSGCSFWSSDSSDTGKTQQTFSDQFLWEKWGEKMFIAFFADMRCNASDDQAINDTQRAVLKQYKLTEAEYLLETKRPDWFTEYAKTGLEETVQNVMKDICPNGKSRY